MFRSRIAKFLLTIFAAASTVLGVALPASASTQTVGFRAGSWYCPNGVYGIDHVEVFGTSSAPSANGSWSGPTNTQTAHVTINGVPSGGGNVYVVVTYHCNVRVLWWWAPGPGEPASGYRWVYGSGSQPTYTL
jgi:hypothetical protein